MLRSVLFVSVALSAAMASSDMIVKTVTSIEENRPSSSGILSKSRTIHLETLFVQGNKLRRESLARLGIAGRPGNVRLPPLPPLWR